MVELISANGVRFTASDEDAPRLIKFGCVPAEPKPRQSAARRARRRSRKTSN
jgi:hypothetical protein